MRRSLDRGRTRSSDDHHARRMHAGAGADAPAHLHGLDLDAPTDTHSDPDPHTHAPREAGRLWQRTDEAGALAAAEYFMELYDYVMCHR